MDEVIWPHAEKTEAIEVHTPPTNVDEVCYFVGLKGYCCKFIPLYLDIAKPLNNLLGKNTPYVWSEECQFCFEQLKEALCKPPILQNLDPVKEYVLVWDAGNYAFTGVFTQADNHPENLKPIAYTSGSFSPVQQHWCATEKGMLFYLPEHFEIWIILMRK